MGGESLAQLGPALVSLLALLLSLFNLYLQRRDRRPRLEIRARYEYRVDTLDGLPRQTPSPRYTTIPKRGCTCCWGTS